MTTPLTNDGKKAKEILAEDMARFVTGEQESLVFGKEQMQWMDQQLTELITRPLKRPRNKRKVKSPPSH